jgi:hypothetical protein
MDKKTINIMSHGVWLLWLFDEEVGAGKMLINFLSSSSFMMIDLRAKTKKIAYV